MNPIRSRLDGVRRTLREDGTLRAVLKHTGWLTGSSGALMMLLQWFKAVLTARLLGIAVWGMLGVALSFCGIAGRLLSFRMNEFVVKWVTQLKGRWDRRGQRRRSSSLSQATSVVAVLAFAVVEALAGWGASTFAKNAGFRMGVPFLGADNHRVQAGRESLIGMLHVNRDFRTQSLVQTACQTAGVCAIGVVYLVGGDLMPWSECS